MYHKRPAQTSAQTNTPTMTHMQHWIHHGVFDVGAQTQIPPQLGQLTSGCGPWSATESAAWVDDPAWIFTGLGCGVPSRLGCGAALLGRRFSKGSRADESFCWKTKWYNSNAQIALIKCRINMKKITNTTSDAIAIIWMNNSFEQLQKKF